MFLWGSCPASRTCPVVVTRARLQQGQVITPVGTVELHNRSEASVPLAQEGLGLAGELYVRTHLDEPRLHPLHALGGRRCLMLLDASP